MCSIVRHCSRSWRQLQENAVFVRTSDHGVLLNTLASATRKRLNTRNSQLGHPKCWQIYNLRTYCNIYFPDFNYIMTKGSFDYSFLWNVTMNDSSLTSGDTPVVVGPSALAKAIISISGFALIATILGGNGLVILLLFRFRRLRTTTNYFILGMASADFMTGIILIASVTIRLNQQIIITPFECMLFWCTTVFTCCLSCLTLLLVSIDRYFKVTIPLRYEIYMSDKKTISIIIAIYLYVFFITYGLPLAGLNQTDKGFDIHCFFQLSKIFTPGLTRFIIYFNVYLPLLLIILMYSHIFRVVMIKLRQEKAQCNPAAVGMKCSRLSMLKREIKTIKTLIMLLGLCICGWVPVTSVMLFEIHNPEYQAGLGLRTIVGYLTFFNSAVNPIVYSLRSEHFRQSSRRLICGRENFKKFKRRRRRIGATVQPLTVFTVEPITAMRLTETIAERVE